MKKNIRHQIGFYALCLSLLVSLCLPLSSRETAYATSKHGAFTDVAQSHWAYESIKQSVTSGIVEGYTDGTFKPNKDVSAIEFIIMFYRAYQTELELPTDEATNWKQPYEQLAWLQDWDITSSQTALSRGDLAQFIYSVLEQNHVLETTAIKFMLAQNYSNGLTSATVEGYGADSLLNRAQAVAFIQNIKVKVPKLSTYVQQQQEPELDNKQPAEQVEKVAYVHEAKLNDIQLGETLNNLVTKLGQADRTFKAGDTTYLSYTGDYTSYALYIVENGTVKGMYSNAKNVWESSKIVSIGQSAPQTKYSKDGAAFVSYYVDKHENNTVEGILLVTSDEVIPHYGETKAETTETAMQNLDMTNAFRVKHGLKPLQWHEGLAETTYKYSVYMEKYDHFDHYNLEGESPFDRMSNDGISYHSAGENIAWGYYNAIEVTNGWINSLGHRNNMLSTNYDYLGVGVYEAYYTQNFIGY